MDETFLLELSQAEILKFGNFTLVNRIISPMIVQFGPILSKPDLLIKISEMLWKKLEHHKFDLICGASYVANALTTCLCIQHSLQMVVARKEPNIEKKLVEGCFKKNQSCLVINDMIATGTSIIDTADALDREGIKVKEAFVILDYQQGGKERLHERGIHVYSLFTINQFLEFLHTKGKIHEGTYKLVVDFLASQTKKK